MHLAISNLLSDLQTTYRTEQAEINDAFTWLLLFGMLITFTMCKKTGKSTVSQSIGCHKHDSQIISVFVGKLVCVVIVTGIT